MSKKEIMNFIIDTIKSIYGINEYGCYVNGNWLSTSEIVEIIEECFENDIYL